MKNVLEIRERCVGCRSCEQICPKHCISMVNDKAGFWYPSVLEHECGGCGLCLEGCPVENTSLHRNRPLYVWAFRNKNDIDIQRSASGGAADIAAKIILENGGVVFGAAYDAQMVVSHIEVIINEDRKKIQSSKYVQSDTKNCYSRVKSILSEGKKVLFTGTPCQIAGLYSFLGKDYESLYTIDLICHGVPSSVFFKKYLEYQEKKMKERVIYYNFRSKEKRGWGTQYMLKTKTKTKTKMLSLDPYGKKFMDGDCYRESCYQCPYANIERVGDLTVGDFWGIAKSHPKFNSAKGISSVFINTKKGEKIFEKMRFFADVERTTIEEGMAKQHNLVYPSERPMTRDSFYASIDSPEFIDKIKIGIQLKARIKSMMPNALIQKIKSL